MGFQQVRPQKSSEIVLEQIKQQIISGAYTPGSKLPTVVELSASFEVGRSTVREALSALKAMGWVDIRHGGGTFVSEKLAVEEEFDASGGLFGQTDSLQEVQEVRKFIEVGCASLAAERRSHEDLAELKQILSQMDAALGNEEESEQTDIRFHLQIAKASQNTLLIGMMESLTERLQASMKASRRLWFFAERASAEQLLQEHRDIYQAIEAQDEKLAADKMMQHILKVDKVVQQLAGIESNKKNRQGRSS
jgi:GntR family transcriptional repressor for pyruvate dehydrogenase complex